MAINCVTSTTTMTLALALNGGNTHPNLVVAACSSMASMSNAQHNLRLLLVIKK